MPGLLADANAELHVELLLGVCRGPRWRLVWEALGIALHDFAGLSIDRKMPDDELWRLCQARNIVLLTSNRNATGAGSLQRTIVREANVRSLPVITIADPQRLQLDGPYRERAADRLMELLVDLDELRGAGRLFIP